MKQYLITLLLFTAALPMFAQDKNKDDELYKDPYSVKRFTEKITQVLSETTGGNISIVGEATSEPRVEMYVHKQNWRTALSKDEIKQKLEADYDVNISVSGGKITATAKSKRKTRDWRDALNISFRIFVPYNTATTLETSGGNISLTSLNGTQDFTTSGGNLTVNKLSGNVKGRTSGGNIYLKDSKDNLDLSTSGGSIYASDCNGKINITTSGGNLELTGLKGDIRAHTSGGNVNGDHISGDLNAATSGGSIRLKEMSGSVDASTSGGNIDLSVSSLTKKISLNNSAGAIYLALPKNANMDLRLSADNIKTNTLNNFKGRQDKERIEGTLNSGGIPVRASSSSGTIHLSLQ
ncbi:MAG: DUF4097 family beta strand repeat-containing protein [Bacteroidota bacterium]